MLWLDFLSPLIFLSASIAVTNAFAAFHSMPNRFSFYKSGANPHYSSGKPTARHKNHCAYVVEKSVSYTVQDGAAPYVKAEYKKCGWGKKCPALRYRMLYKPVFKVAYKTMTELEWRCCPGFTGVGCNIGPTAYGMKAMPPFKGHVPSYKGPMPSHKGPQLSIKGPLSSYKGSMPPFKGPISAFKGHMTSYNGPVNAYEERVPFHKGPMPLFQGSMSQPNYNRNLWNQPLTPSNIMDEYPDPNAAPSYPETSFEPYQEPETDHPDTVLEQHNPLTNDQDSVHDPISDDHEPITNYQDPIPDHQQSIPHPETKPLPETQASSGDSEVNQAVEENSVRVERLNQMEEDVQRLSLGLETLRAKVTSLEDHLRASLREDANRMLSTLLSEAPVPIAAASQDMTIGFGDLPGGAPDIEGSDAIGQFPNLGELAEKVAQLHAEVLAKSTDLVELKKTVLDHEETLQRLPGGALNLTDSQQALETLLETKLSKAGAAVLGEFDKRVETAEQRCEDRVMEVHLQCKKEIMEGQEQLEQVVNSSLTALKIELANIYAEHQGLESDDACCTAMSGMTERLVLLEQSMDGLNQSQVHLQVELGGHKDHVEGMVEGRLAYVESLLSTTEKEQGCTGERTAGILEDCLEEKIKDLEIRLFAAMEELANATSTVLVECQTVPTLDTEVKSLKKRVEVDLDLIQKQLSSLELVCTSSCAPEPVLTGYAEPLITLEEKDKKTHENLNGQLSAQTERLDQLNATLNSLLTQLTERQEEKELQGEVTLLKVSMHSVNHTLCGLKDSFGKVVREVGQTNLTWQEREERLAQQVKGVVQLVGRQASMLGAGERRLTRLKGELQDLRRRLASEMQTCHSTALGVQKEVTDVGGRVARVEGQCGGLSQLAEDLELIRGELEKYSDGYFSQVNSTLVSHSLQLSELRDGLKTCTKSSGLTGDHVVAVTQPSEEQHTVEPPKPRGDQFIDPTQV
ncbi:EMILIN-3 isoform X1 [Pangasianodon hypophthalmus]|uniref:EMILIN-3 isoform X1 n=2 Tax=Pangasianodon hypophthalmus TaxID=310915 RepID=UPI000EFF753D|nr:EMILIN-3 isoform X1 [Pangasianodon hypophthalmus]